MACEWAVLARCLMCLAVPSCLFPLSVVLGGGWGFGGHSCLLMIALELGARFAPSILYLRQYKSQKVVENTSSVGKVRAKCFFSQGPRAPLRWNSPMESEKPRLPDIFAGPKNRGFLFWSLGGWLQRLQKTSRGCGSKPEVSWV